jgi:hypothetical protein
VMGCGMGLGDAGAEFFEETVFSRYW